jgi:hypothetical protein
MGELREYAADLIVARRLLTEGVEAVEAGDDIRIRAGILLADLSAESLLKLVLRWYGSERSRDSKFPELIKQVIAAAPEGGPALTYVRDLTALRTMRNSVMHDGLGQLPDAAQARVSATRSVLARLARDVFHVDLINLNYQEFIRSPWIKSFMAEAMKHEEAEQFVDALGYCRAAFDSLIVAWRAYMRALFDLDQLGFRRGPDDRRTEERAAKHELALTAISAGIFLPDLRRFRDATKGIAVSVGPHGDLLITNTGVTDSTESLREHVRYARDFVGGLTLQLESRFGDSLPGNLERERQER